MKLHVAILALSGLLLVGCDKAIQAVQAINDCNSSGGKNCWVYKEEADKLNNSLIINASGDYLNKEQGILANLSINCADDKDLYLQVKTFKLGEKSNTGEIPGLDLALSEGDGVEFLRTRSGSNKLAVQLKEDMEYTNVAKFSISSNGTPESSNETVQALNLLKQVTNTVVGGVFEATHGYSLIGIAGTSESKFMSKEWIVEVPTVSGKVVAQVDLSDQTLKKVLQRCNWKPAFSE